MNRCPRCNCEATGQNRLVTDSCGHSKCRACLLADISDCLECQLLTRRIPVATDAAAQSAENATTIVAGVASDNHISSTGQGWHCTVCNKSLRSRTQQYYHRSCGNELLKKFHCALCSRRFATRSHLKYHQSSHGTNPSYCCNNCGKSFKQKIVLQRHMRAHKPHAFGCPDCPRLFHNQSALTAHAVLHSGDSLPFKCETCSKHYLTKANLKQHQLKHDLNSTRHSCPVCSKSFLRQSTLRLHQQRHVKRARRACSQCQKTFNDVDALTRHMKQHTATQSYRCTLCEVTVNRRDNMLRHLRSMHPGVQFDAGVLIIDAASSDQLTSAPASTSAQNVRYNSVIQSVGNVQPVFIPQQPQVTLESPAADAPLVDQMQKENVKLYRKIILDLDNEEYSNELSNELDMDATTPAPDGEEQQVLQQPQRIPNHGSSNFSERHWRKNFKNSYENEHTN
ncbi:zinc finger protein 391 [Drosophila grimshawi]|uniref:zinc finger protein 391 n=1 Tax=Drosophila grimshawi TaxID=7222 RepID=UPI000C86E6A8|nr:zinc finger protein 391 [Drosophila grimshawi]